MKAKKFLSLLLCAALVLTLMPVVTITASAVDNIPYVDEAGNDLTAATATVIDESTTALANGWYVASGIVSTGTLTVSGDVKLILADGCNLTVTGSTNNAGVAVTATNSLTVYSQALGTGKLTANGGTGGAGIGGGEGGSAGTITITGGTVTANGGVLGAGIGGVGGAVTIRGGTVTANGGSIGAGIGGTITISGGSVNAISMGTQPTNGTANGSLSVYLTTVALDGVTAETAVSALTTDAGYSYGVNGMKTDGNGMLYLYLPNEKSALAAQTASVCYTGKVEATSSAPPASGTLVPGDFAVTGSGYTYPNHVLTIGDGGDYTVSMRTGVTSTTTDKIAVNGGTDLAPVNITLNGVSIVQSTDTGGCAFELQGSSVVNLTLGVGTANELTSGGLRAGLQVPAGTTLAIGGTGSLDATSSSFGAGIGGNFGGSCGTVYISGGTVTATSVDGGAGIGSSLGGGSGGTVYISGGAVTANGGYGGAGIGGGLGNGGSNGDGGTVTITGGSVNTTSMGTQPTNGTDNGDQNVYLTTVILTDASGTAVSGAFVSALTASLSGSSYTYGTTGMYTDVDGKLYLYLPKDTAVTRAVSSSLQYTGSVTSNIFGTAADMLTLLAVTGVTPVGTGAALDGNIAVTFSKEMNTASGAVSLNNGTALMFGIWSQDKKTYTVPYSGLSYGTSYTVKISGFQDAAGNTMDDDATRSFTTLLSSDASLSGLTVSRGTLRPAFVSGTTTYRAAVSNSVDSVTVTPTVNEAHASVTVNGTAATSGGASGAVSLSVGRNIITVVVTAQDKTATQTYTITVTRANADSGDDSEVNYYTITSTAGKGGTISPSGSSSVCEGQDIVFAITPSTGYAICDVKVDGVSVGAVKSYTFDNVQKAHTVTVSFKKIVTNPFADVKTGDWFFDNVLYVYEKGLMTGTAPDTFRPNTGMTRAMVVTVLYRISGDTDSYTNVFSDVPSGQWYENAVAWAAENGIAGGVGNGLFAPDTEVTREQLAVMLYRYAKYKGYDVSIGEDTNILSYKDALSISEYAYSALQWACGAGIMNGDTSGNLNPQSSATRAEVAAMLQRFIEKVTD